MLMMLMLMLMLMLIDVGTKVYFSSRGASRRHIDEIVRPNKGQKSVLYHIIMFHSGT